MPPGYDLADALGNEVATGGEGLGFNVGEVDD